MEPVTLHSTLGQVGQEGSGHLGPGEVAPVNGDEAVATRSFLVRA